MTSEGQLQVKALPLARRRSGSSSLYESISTANLRPDKSGRGAFPRGRKSDLASEEWTGVSLTDL